jgi:hypothetical protein
MIKRPWIKVRLSANLESWEAIRIVQAWREKRQTASNIVRAICLYQALKQHDTRLLLEYFPWLAGTSKPLTGRHKEGRPDHRL